MDDTSRSPAGQQQVTISEAQFAQIRQLCDFMQMLRAWWAHFQDVIRHLDRTAATKAHDLLIEGVATARRLARELNIELPDTSSINWAASPRYPTAEF